jgi:predicted house-cleaning noncanonical NTP pyrophosphatase (MazG superfamily)
MIERRFNIIKTYNKLVRDNIPNVIEKNNGKADYTILSDDEYIIELDKKLNEEIAEYQESKSIDEIADVLEVLLAICKARGFTEQELMDVKAKKAEKNGAFNHKIYLKTVEQK